MNSKSDFDYYLELENESLTNPLEIYRGCIVVACSGKTHSAESQLNDSQRYLLNIRRLIHQAKWQTALDQLQGIDQESIESPLAGDVSFLKAQILHFMGHQSAAKLEMLKASKLYQENNDMYRSIRAEVNAHIANGDLNSVINGTLFLLEKKVKQFDFPEITAHVLRARAQIFAQSEMFTDAIPLLKESIQLYSRKGYPQDECVARVSLAICYLHLGRHDEAIAEYKNCHIKDGKVKPFIDFFNSMMSEQKPIVPIDHPLFQMPWIIKHKQDNKVTSKILRLLKMRDFSRDELIYQTWGPNSDDPSYVTRLHSAIRQVKKKHNVQIDFDGERYRLIS